MNKRNVSHHAKKRIKEREGTTQAKEIEKKVTCAWKKGIKHSEAKGDLCRWMDGCFLRHRSATDMRLYCGYLYIFGHNQVLFTMYPLPGNLKENMLQYVDTPVYRRYMSDINNKARKNNKRNEKKYNEKKKKFLELVLLRDLMGFAFRKGYMVEISGYHVEDNLLCIHYIPHTRQIPDMNEMTDYIRKNTDYHRVKLVHVKDVNGHPVFR